MVGTLVLCHRLLVYVLKCIVVILSLFLSTAHSRNVIEREKAVTHQVLVRNVPIEAHALFLLSKGNTVLLQCQVRYAIQSLS